MTAAAGSQEIGRVHDIAVHEAQRRADGIGIAQVERGEDDIAAPNLDNMPIVANSAIDGDGERGGHAAIASISAMLSFTLAQNCVAVSASRAFP